LKNWSAAAVNGHQGWWARTK